MVGVFPRILLSALGLSVHSPGAAALVFMNREPRKAGCRTSEQGADAGTNGSFTPCFTTSRRVDVRKHFQRLKPQSLPETFTGKNKRYAT
jgi:hypothetical protein